MISHISLSFSRSTLRDRADIRCEWATGPFDLRFHILFLDLQYCFWLINNHRPINLLLGLLLDDRSNLIGRFDLDLDFTVSRA